MPDPPSTAFQVEVELELLDLIQVRDMTGDGTVIKRRLKQGQGEFPIDCPLQDTTVCLHYRVRRLQLSPGQTVQEASSSSGGFAVRDSNSTPWAFDSRQRQGESSDSSSGAIDPPPLVLDTGCGEMPSALELAIKLMVPGELARVASLPSHAYKSASALPEEWRTTKDAAGGGEEGVSSSTPSSLLTPPPGITPSDAVEFEVELVSFDKEGHWLTMPMADRFFLAENIRAKANALFRSKRYVFARRRYERLLRLAQSTRDYEEQADVDRMDALQLALLSNLVLCCHNQGEYVEAVAYATKALNHDQASVKLLLRRARAQSMKGDYEKAEMDLRACKEHLQHQQQEAADDESDEGRAGDDKGGPAAPSPPGALATAPRKGGGGAEGGGSDASPLMMMAQEVDKEIALNKSRAMVAAKRQKSTFRSFFDR